MPGMIPLLWPTRGEVYKTENILGRKSVGKILLKQNAKSPRKVYTRDRKLTVSLIDV